MAVKYGTYKCEICGNLITVIDDGGGDLVCCGQEMTLLQEKTSAQEGKEKHVPVITVEGNKVTVKVGSIPHPMEEKHYIEFIQLFVDGKLLYIRRLVKGDLPQAEFYIKNPSSVLRAREFCNLHGLWTS